MSEPKTKPTSLPLETFLATIDDPERRADCAAIAALMQSVSGEPAVLWGNIIGFGSYRYRYASGREGDWPLVAFAPRKGDISLYLASDYPRRAEHLSRLGRHKTGKSCVYVRRLSDIDPSVLREMIEDTVQVQAGQHVHC
jgi:hypothetical protein